VSSPLAMGYVQNSRSGCQNAFSFWTLAKTLTARAFTPKLRQVVRMYM